MTSLFRFLLDDTDDAGDLQTLRGQGVAGEELTGVHRIQPHGFHSVPPKGSHGIALALHGQRDLAVALGLESPQYRPRSREVGSTAIYGIHGQVVSLVEAETRVVHAKRLVFEVGPCSLTITPEGFAFAGGTIKHDGKSIDKTHVHGGILPGGSNTDVPSN